jgi:hypothetical protein
LDKISNEQLKKLETTLQQKHAEEAAKETSAATEEDKSKS